MSTTNTTQIPPAINSLFQQLQNQNFQGQLALKISDFKGTLLEHLFSLLQCSDSLIIDQIHTNDSEPNCNQFSFEGQFSHDLMGVCVWHCQFAIDRDTNSPHIIAGFISLVPPNKLWPWLISDVFASGTCNNYRLKYNSKSPQEVSVSGTQNEPEQRHFLWIIDDKQQTATLDLKLQIAFEIKGMFDLSMSDLQGKLNWQKDKDVHGILSGTATFGSKTLPIELAVPSPANELLFTYNNKAKGSFTSIADIFEALPLDNKLYRLVEPIKDLIGGADIQLNYIQFYVDAYTKQPKSVVVEVQLNKQWEVADGLTFANPTMRLSLGQHISLKKPFWIGQLSTTVKLFNKEFVAKISLPDNTLGFSLANNNTISLTDIASAFGFDNSGMPSIALTDFFISYNLKIEEWTIAAKVNSDLSFKIGDQTLQLVEAGFLLKKSSKLTTCMIYGQMALDGKRCEVKLLNNGRGWTLSANIPDTIPVHSIVEHYFKSSGFQLPAQLPTFDINQLNLSYTPSDKAFSFSGNIVSDVSVSIGVEKISLKQLDFKITSLNKVTTGHIKGTVQTSFMKLNVAYDLAKGPVFEATFPDIDLNTLADKLCGGSVMQQIGVPVDFPDFHIKDSKLILSLKDSKVQVSASLDGDTSVLFELRKEPSGWGFAAGIQVNVENLSILLGDAIGNGFKSMIGKLSDWILVKDFTFIISSLKHPTFPVFSSFDQPPNTNTTSNKITMPSIPNLEAGIFLFAKSQFTKEDRGLKAALSKLLQIPQETEIDIFLAIQKNQGLNNIQLGVGIKTYVTIGKNEGAPSRDPNSNGELIGILYIDISTALPSLSMQATLKTKIQNAPVEFHATINAFSHAIVVSGSIITTDPIQIGPIKLANIGLTLGVSILPVLSVPSFGFTAEIKGKESHSSLAVLADLQDPSQSMIAGSLSDFTFGDILEALLGLQATNDSSDKKASSSINEALEFLKSIKIKGTKNGAFNVNDQDAVDLINALKKHNGEFIATHFNKKLNIKSFPSKSPDLIIFYDTGKGKWYITEQADDALINHWQLTKQADGSIGVSKEAQFYFAPQDTNIGAFKYKRGMKVSGRIAFHDFELDVDILLEDQKGLKVIAEMDKIVIGAENLFSIAADKGAGGPKVNICTYSQPEEKEKEFQSPHFFINGELTLLGSKCGIYASVTSDKIHLEIDLSILKFLEVKLAGSFSKNRWNLDGDIKVTISEIDLGPLGKINPDTSAKINLKISGKSSGIEATLNGEIEIIKKTIPIDIKPGKTIQTFEQIADLVTTELATNLKNTISKQVDPFLQACKDGLITDVDIAVLKSVFNLNANQAAEALKKAGYTAADVGEMLKSAYEFGAKDTAKVLKEAGYEIEAAASVLQTVHKIEKKAIAEALEAAGHTAEAIGKAIISIFK